ncbi:Glutathione S-transferase, N-terminal domain [Rhizoctonia solani]|uniref:Glutathione S-transferase, N-terminal domain n=1 Tax=Rhizoctonia solani TaxID=456999 RepID=A0A8H7M0X2_9AGAM|nr:Glutathione S-transferase, N-terminal domain [Rhizoctonia solani]
MAATKENPIIFYDILSEHDLLRTQVRNTVTPARDRHLVATSSPRSPRPPAPLSGPSLSCDSLAPSPRPSGTRGPHAVVALIRTTLAPIRPNSDLDHRFLRSVAQSLSAPHSLSSRTSFISSCISLLSFSPVSPSGLTDTFYRRPRPPCILTLNYKRIPYRVEYLSYPDIAPKLKELGVRTTDPAPFIAYTLPMIADPSSDPNGKPTYVVESFDIAVYLDKTYPAPKYPALFPPGTRAVQKITSDLFMNEVGYTLLPGLVPLTARPGFLDERGRQYFLKTREQYMKLIPDDTSIGSKFWGDAHEKWKWFGEVLDLNEEGPFVTGKQISFTDFAVGGMIFFVRTVEGGEMQRWKAMAEWQGGRWARLWAEIEKLEKESTEVA